MNLSKRELVSILDRGHITIRTDQKMILDQIKDAPETKYHNQPVTIDGIYFQSQAEAARWFEIQLMIRGRLLVSAERQKKYRLPGGINYILDHLLAYPDGRQEAEECKGYWTRTAINKCKQFVEIYQIPLYIVKDGQRASWNEAIGELREFYFPRKKGNKQRG